MKKKDHSLKLMPILCHMHFDIVYKTAIWNVPLIIITNSFVYLHEEQNHIYIPNCKKMQRKWGKRKAFYCKKNKNKINNFIDNRS